MSASDNVLRGGLTRKHVDVTELLSVLDFTPSPVPHLRATVLSPGVEEFAPGVSDFRLLRVRLGTTGSGTSASRVGIAGPAIILAVAGEATVAGCVSSATIARGQSLYVTPDESVLELSGSGDFFIATTGEQHPECWEDTERVETTTTTIVADRRADLDSAIDAAVAEAIGVARTEGRRGIRVTRQNDRQVTVELTAAVPFGLTHVEDLRGLL
ncbi:hypothetical protein [Arthrobacter sp. SD76]|uniref:hypothetical protein n=1 Tax=Arthrobacter sp. SD76 TaxID=3415007 RepID=UPI003C743208